jgi:hypothetical protein
MSAISTSTTGRHRLASTLLFAALLLEILISFPGNPTAAQPLCLGDKIWNNGKGKYVPLSESQPTEEAKATEPPPPAETVDLTPLPI